MTNTRAPRPHTPRSRIYCASPFHRAKMWRTDLIPSLYGGRIHVVSTWHDIEYTPDDNNDPMICAMSWEENFKEIRQADALLAYAEHKDRPNGTLVEIGYALAMELPVCLVGNFDWASWRHHTSVIHFSTLREAVAQITGESLNAENP